MKIVSRYLLFINLAIISYLAFIPNYNSMPDIFSLSDKLNHTIAFFVLSILLWFSFNLKKSYQILLLMGYAFFIEIVQYFLPNRYFGLDDILADCFGILLFWIIIYLKNTLTNK